MRELNLDMAGTVLCAGLQMMVVPGSRALPAVHGKLRRVVGCAEYQLDVASRSRAVLDASARYRYLHER